MFQQEKSFKGTMNTKIIISLLLLISAHNSFCMLINPSQTKQSKKIIRKHYAIATEFTNSFAQRSLKNNFQIFNNLKSAIQSKIIFQETNKGEIFNLMQLPEDLHITILANFFENNDKRAAKHFYEIPLKQALKKYNKTSYLKRKNKLPTGMLFLLNDEQENILTRIYQGRNISKRNYCDLINNLQNHILDELYKQQKIVNISTGVDPLKVLLLTPFQTMWNIPAPTLFLYLNTSKDMATGIFIFGTLSILSTIKSIEQFISAIPSLQTVMKFSAFSPPVTFLLLIAPFMVENYITTTRKQITLA